MRFLFIIQGEGRGHFTQALALQQILQQKGDTLCAVIVGKVHTGNCQPFIPPK